MGGILMIEQQIFGFLEDDKEKFSPASFMLLQQQLSVFFFLFNALKLEASKK